ncbi:MAG: glutathione S-transferase family protein [Caulobacter sp.]|nr:glutathione S-transferase family protein [Caulobacter sp.]
MKLYGEDNPAPNPRRVRIFLAEKGAAVEHVRVPLRERAHKAEAFLEKNSLGQVPVLELDDGSFLSESVSICRYLDGLYPDPPLFGDTPKAQATIDMWIRRIEFQLMAPIAHIWRHTHPLTAGLLTQFKDFGESNRAHADRVYRWLDGELADRTFIAGPAYSMADIVALTTVDFGRMIGVAVPEDCSRVLAWLDHVSRRPSAAA